MLDEITLQLSVNSDITNFCMPSEEISKLCRYLVINLHKRILTLVGTNMPGSSLAVILDDHVMHDHISLHHLPHLIMRPTSLHHLYKLASSPLVRGGGRQRSVRSGTRWATTGGEKSSEGDRQRSGVSRSQNTPRSAPVSTTATEGWATREERRGERKAREATG
jgi:hypothetical protein